MDISRKVKIEIEGNGMVYSTNVNATDYVSICFSREYVDVFWEMPARIFEA